MSDLERAMALIALTEQTYIENYYGDNIVLFNRNETASGTNANTQHVESVER